MSGEPILSVDHLSGLISQRHMKRDEVRSKRILKTHFSPAQASDSAAVLPTRPDKDVEPEIGCLLGRPPSRAAEAKHRELAAPETTERWKFIEARPVVPARVTLQDR